MKLTEAKLKQLINEALKNSKFKDFDVLTPDEKLRSQLGDEMFDKLQSLDPEQADIMKQSFDPNYPRKIKQESFEDLLKPFGFKQAYSELRPKDRWRDPMRIKTYDAYISSPNKADRFYVNYRIVRGSDYAYIQYRTSLWSDSDNEYIYEVSSYKHESNEFPHNIIDLEIESDEGDRAVESIILAKEKENILAAIKELK